MISDRQLTANRRNARASTGPRSPRGKATASRNAIRHGFEALKYCDPSTKKEIARIVRMIDTPDAGPLLREQSIIIAECTVIIEQIRALRSAAVGRVHAEPQTSSSILESDVSVCRKRPLNFEAEDYWRRLEEECHEQYRLKQLAKATKDQRQITSDRTSALSLKDEKVLGALDVFESLERYEARAVSRRRRALRTLGALLGSKQPIVRNPSAGDIRAH